ncbi:MAG: lytic transglycosylase domain-containing protein [Defluviitaleaceae bacterium]|nr:lytic transglycosylase domain-containing protein [Defluviitaleaceae bacterium]MCL2837183.1 lytic transglycosylase domain-containing protein [Defluviitaleaceae bacterium]
MYSRTTKPLLIAAIILILTVAAFLLGLTALYPVKFTALISEFSEKYELPPELVYAVIHTESRFRPHALSSKEASGLMQLTRQTADWGAEVIGLNDYHYVRVFEPHINIELGCWYLQTLLKQFDGELNTALAAYNAGSGNVTRWLQNEEHSADGRTLRHIPFGETSKYVERVNAAIPIYNFLLRIFGVFIS